MFKLIIEDDEGKTTPVPITRDEITVGRKEGNNIRLTERNVSRHHARFSRQPNGIYIEDLDSYNGVRINGDRISVKTPVLVNVGDLIEIGDYHLAIQAEGEDAAGLASSGDESTQRVSMPNLHEATSPGTPPEEVTSRVQMPTAPEATQPGWNGAGGPQHAIRPDEHTPDPTPQRRAEPTAIIRTSDLPREPESAPSRKAVDGQRLVVVSTALAGKVIPLDRPEVVLGRTDDSDVQLDHRSVSRNHAKLVRDGERWSVVDLNSANGVLVNGEEYKRIDLRKGDIIELGHVKLRFVEAGEDFSLSEGELERLRKEEPDNDFNGPDSTGVIAGRGASQRPAKKGLPMPALVGGGVVLLLLVGGGILAMTRKGGTEGTTTASTSGGSTNSDPRPDNDEPRDPPNEKKPPSKVKDPPRSNGDKAAEEKAARERAAAEKAAAEKAAAEKAAAEDDKGTDKEKALRSAAAAVKAGDFIRARELYLPHASSDAEARRGLELVDREIKGRGQLDEALELKVKDPARSMRLLESVMDGTRARERADVELKALKPVVAAKLIKDADRAMAEGNLREAEATLEDVEALDPGNRELGKARERLEKARNKKATPPPPPPPNRDSGVNKTAESKKALDDCNRAILLGNFEDAVSKGKLALKYDPTQTEAHKLLGVAYARQAKYCDAKFHYKKYIELNPNSATVDRVKGILATPDMQACP